MGGLVLMLSVPGMANPLTDRELPYLQQPHTDTMVAVSSVILSIPSVLFEQVLFIAFDSGRSAVKCRE